MRCGRLMAARGGARYPVVVSKGDTMKTPPRGPIIFLTYTTSRYRRIPLSVGATLGGVVVHRENAQLEAAPHADVVQKKRVYAALRRRSKERFAEEGGGQAGGEAPEV